jgi:lysozyme family protein
MANYNNFHSTVAFLEGGFQKKESDPGNFNSKKELVGTNHGISAPVFEKWIGRVPTEIDMRSISKNTASLIFKSNYWNRLGADYIKNQAIAETLVDHGINAGVYASGKIMQQVLNDNFGMNLVVDGALGPLTIEAINSVNPLILFQEFSEARIVFYKRINNSFWEKGWLKRVQVIADKFSINLKKKA